MVGGEKRDGSVTFTLPKATGRGGKGGGVRKALRLGGWHGATAEGVGITVTRSHAIGVNEACGGGLDPNEVGAFCRVGVHQGLDVGEAEDVFESGDGEVRLGSW